jgi:hypothetical protein
MKYLLIIIVTLISVTFNSAIAKSFDFEYESPKKVLTLLKDKTDKETMIKLTAIYITWVTIAKSEGLYPDIDRQTAMQNATELLKEMKSDQSPLKILKHQYKKNAKINLEGTTYYVSVVFPNNLIATAYGPFPPFTYSEEEVKNSPDTTIK